MLVTILRNYQGELTQEEYAARLGITQGGLSLIYSRKRGIGTDVIRALLRAFPQAGPEIAAALAAPADPDATPAPLALVS